MLVGHHTSLNNYLYETQSYLIDLGRTFDIESLSMSLKTNSFFKKNKVPLDTLTGIRIRSARTVIGTKIFNLHVTEKQNSKFIYEDVQDIKHQYLKT